MSDTWIARLLSARLSLVVPVLAMLGILVLSSVPGTIPQDAPAAYQVFVWVPPKVQNLLHIPVYAVLAFLWRWALGAHLRPALAALAALAITIGFGILDEAYQSLIPGRYPSITDVGLNSLGAVLGALAFAWLASRTSEGRR